MTQIVPDDIYPSRSVGCLQDPETEILVSQSLRNIARRCDFTSGRDDTDDAAIHADTPDRSSRELDTVLAWLLLELGRCSCLSEYDF